MELFLIKFGGMLMMILVFGVVFVVKVIVIKEIIRMMVCEVCMVDVWGLGSFEF